MGWKSSFFFYKLPTLPISLIFGLGCHCDCCGKQMLVLAKCMRYMVGVAEFCNAFFYLKEAILREKLENISPKIGPLFGRSIL